MLGNVYLAVAAQVIRRLAWLAGSERNSNSDQNSLYLSVLTEKWGKILELLSAKARKVNN